MSAEAATVEPTRSEVDAMAGRVLLEFGASWCGHCHAAQPALQSLLDAHGGVTHLRVEDGPGKPLGRSFRVRLWPTFVLVDAGVELVRVVRPVSPAEFEPMAGELRG